MPSITIRWVLAGMSVLVASLSPSASAAGSDWPQFLGPGRDGVYRGDDIAAGWAAGGPRVLWHREVGQGWSAPVVSRGKALMFHRTGNVEKLECVEAETGKPLWLVEAPTHYQDDFGFDEGPRATPTICQKEVYTFGAEGTLCCREFSTGKEIWRVDTMARFNQGKGFFGMACSPLIEGRMLIVNIGAENAGVVAFDRLTGKTLWTATSDEASYSSPAAATVDGKRQLFVFTRAGLDAIEPETGKVVFQFPWRAGFSASVNAATPLIIDDTIFISASYGAGATLLKFKEGGPEQLWAGDDILSNHYSTSVCSNGFLYGFDGRQERGQRLRCVELLTGKIRWSADDFGAGTLLLVDRPKDPILLILSEKGELFEVAATPDGFRPLGHKQLVGFSTRANAALAEGLYYARGKSQWVCVDLRRS